MFPQDFESFDPTPYHRTPMLNILKTLALGRALEELIPTEPPEVVERAAQNLTAVLDEGDQAVDTRREESVPVDISGEMELDTVADTLWGVLRDALETKAALSVQGLSRLAEGLAPESPIAKAVAAAQDQATRARTLSTRLFGANGLAFTRSQFPEQSQAMASMLRVIEKNGLADEIDALAGPEILVLLRACQPLYESMVDTRLARDNRKTSDLRRMRNKINRAINRYSIAVLTMLDENEPQTLPLVVAALRPIEQIRATNSPATTATPSPTAPKPAPAAEPTPAPEPEPAPV